MTMVGAVPVKSVFVCTRTFCLWSGISKRLVWFRANVRGKASSKLGNDNIHYIIH